jgi:hypothetical protein
VKDRAAWQKASAETLKSGRYHSKTLQSLLGYTAFIVTVALFDAFQVTQSAQGIIERLFLDGMEARDLAHFFEARRNFNSRIPDSPCDLGILQFHHSHSVKVYPKLFIRISHTFFNPKVHRAV